MGLCAFARSHKLTSDSRQRLCVATFVCLHVCTVATDSFFVCVYPGHIVWTGKMRMDGTVITEWRYPHSVKLEKAGQKPPTGTASKEGVVVMVIGEFKQGSANLQGKRCERESELVFSVGGDL